MTICPVHVRLEGRVDDIDKRLWKTRHWLIYIAFAAFVASFLGSYAGRQWSIAEALLAQDTTAPESSPLEREDDDRPLISWRF